MKLPVAPEAAAMAKLIRAQMTVRGVRQIPMAKKLGISQTTLSNKLNGKVTFDATEILVACEELNVNSTELWKAGIEMAHGGDTLVALESVIS